MDAARRGVRRLQGTATTKLPWLRDARMRATALAVTGVFLTVELLTLMQPFFTVQTYNLGRADALLTPVNQSMARKLQYDQSTAAYQFNKEAAAQPTTIHNASKPKVSAVAPLDAAKGVTVTDPVNKIDLTMKPKFEIVAGRPPRRQPGRLPSAAE